MRHQIVSEQDLGRCSVTVVPVDLGWSLVLARLLCECPLSLR